MLISCPQIYSALCDHFRIAAALAIESAPDIERTTAAIQHALIWGEYRHGDHSRRVSDAVERHLVRVIQDSEAAILPLAKGLSAEVLCGASTPLLVGRVVLDRTGCGRTAAIAEDVASAHAGNDSPFAPLPFDTPASALFAACALASGMVGAPG